MLNHNERQHVLPKSDFPEKPQRNGGKGVDSADINLDMTALSLLKWPWPCLDLVSWAL